ncbi:4'-phosphopantetheinyl transferase family protein [Actinoplanes sp. CA-030573]|uniref:4'-phosphopantetheinyl transferase family protein n=1 Tax=Actinoplanes sp. CA-030573 TaxID=3239898 RepID=UPI003D925D0D
MIDQLLPPNDVAVAEAFGDVPGEPVFPGEERLVATAVEARRREFVTGRRCAREALGKLGIAPVAIGTGPQREPLWPAGVAGAITHCPGYRAAAVTTKLAAVGIDAEPDEPLPSGVAEHIMTAGEPRMVAALSSDDPSVCWDRLVFSAKESIYKAWYPLTARWLDFSEAVLTVDPAAGTFEARLLADGGPRLAVISGRFLVARGLILTAVTVDGR